MRINPRDDAMASALIRIECAECGCAVESGRRVVICATPDCCCAHLPFSYGLTRTHRRGS